MFALIRYLAIVVADGDHLNDYLTHLPSWSTDAAQLAGWLLAIALGY